MSETSSERAYQLAREAYLAVGVDTEAALGRLDGIPISMHCWQGDDVRGFENPQGKLTGGISATGNYPGRARNADELRADFEVATAQIPGPKRFNLHATYLEADRPVERNEIRPEHFQRWVDWARQLRLRCANRSCPCESREEWSGVRATSRCSLPRRCRPGWFRRRC